MFFKSTPSLLVFTSLVLLVLVGCDTDDDNGRPRPPKLDPEIQDPTVIFSHAGGFHEEGFELELHTTTPSSAIHYTLDGSEPDENSPKFVKPLRISSRKGEANRFSEIPTNAIKEGPHQWRLPEGEVFKGTVVRARAWDRETAVPGPISTVSYFIGNDLSSRYPLPVVSISLAPFDFFSDEWGLYVPGNSYDPDQELSGNYYTITGRDSEVRVHFELFERNGHPSLSFMAGTRIHGAFSRRIPQKTLRLYLRNEYLLNHLSYPLFPDKGVQKYKRFLLRNSGNDWAITMIIDTLGQALARGTRMDRQYHRSVIVFINGEYWGIHQLRDRLDKHHFGYHYSADTADVVVINHHKEVAEGTKADLQEYLELLEFIEKGGVKKEQDYEFIGERLDLDTLIDYHAINIYAGNHDWPFNNVKSWRLRMKPDLAAGYGKDGRWRFAMYDLDQAFAWYASRYERDTLAHALDPEIRGTGFLRGLLAYEPFRDRFLIRFADLLNTRFTSEHVISLVDEFASEIADALPEHIKRWRNLRDMEKWKEHIELQRDFARRRPESVRKFLAHHLKFKHWHELTLEPTGKGRGVIRVNDYLTLDESNAWAGLYPEGVTLRIRAHPLAGSCFAGWEDQKHSSPLLSVRLSSAKTYKARFLPVGDEDCLSTPVPHPLLAGDYVFDEWSDLEPAGVHPPSMQVLMGATKDEELSSPGFNFDAGLCPYDGVYDWESKTRVNGHGEFGLSFVNTASSEHCGWVDSLLLSLDTRGMSTVSLSFTAGTLARNSRVHGLRLQYRVGSTGAFTDLQTEKGEAIEYIAESSGSSKRFENIALPSKLREQAELQLRWKYYFTGVRRSEESGARSQLRLDDIRVSGTPSKS